MGINAYRKNRQNIRENKKFTGIATVLVSFWVLFITAPPLYATEGKEILYNIPAQPLAMALRTFAKNSNISLVFSEPSLSNSKSQNLTGPFSVHQGLNKILQGTGHSYKVANGRVFYIIKKPLLSKDNQNNSETIERDEPPQNSFEEIIVTALRRSSPLQKTPISISALSGERLSKLGAIDLLDYASFVNGLTIVDTGPGQRRLVIRGIQGIGEAQVGLYYGEVPVTGTPGSNSSSGQRQPEILLFDTDRIEVLRGPQGTLYGTGSMGGTVRILFKEPNLNNIEHSYEGRVSHTKYGGFNYQFNSSLNLPLVTDKLSFRAVGYYHSEGGYIDNIRLNKTNVNAVENWGTRLQFKMQPAENLSLLFSTILQRLDLNNLSHWYPDIGLYKSTDYASTHFKDNTDIFNFKLDWELADLTAQMSSSYYQRDIIDKWDTTHIFVNLDRAVACRNINAGEECNISQQNETDSMINSLLPLVVFQPQSLKSWTKEIRLKNNGSGPLLWTIGAFFEERSSTLTSQIYHVDESEEKTRLSNIQFHRYSSENLKQIAFFGEVVYKIKSNLAMTLGTRYFNYTKKIEGETLIGIPLFNTVPRDKETLNSKEGKWVHKIHTAYNFNNNILLYAQASEGYRIGGANQVIGLPESLTPFTADKLWNYEIGAKTSWLGKKLIFNGALYWINWDNMQVRGQTKDGAFEFISNAGAAQIKGLEIELSYYPIDNFLISLALNYNKAHLTEDQVSKDLRAQGRKGDRIPFVPKVTGSVYSQYSWYITPELKSTVSAALQFIGQSNSEFDTTDPYNEKMGKYAVINLRYDMEFGNWGVYLFADNILNKVAITRQRSSEFWDKQSFSLSPQTIGVGLQASF